MTTQNRDATPEETRALLGKGWVIPVPKPDSSVDILKELMKPKAPSTELQDKRRRLLQILQEEARSKSTADSDTESKP